MFSNMTALIIYILSISTNIKYYMLNQIIIFFPAGVHGLYVEYKHKSPTWYFSQPDGCSNHLLSVSVDLMGV